MQINDKTPRRIGAYNERRRSMSEMAKLGVLGAEGNYGAMPLITFWGELQDGQERIFTQQRAVNLQFGVHKLMAVYKLNTCAFYR